MPTPREIAQSYSERPRQPWHSIARKMRAEGQTLQAIAAVFDVTPNYICRVCRGIVCPIDHRGASAPRRDASAAFVAEHYGKMSASQIGRRLGISRNAVIGLAYRMGLSKPRATETGEIIETTELVQKMHEFTEPASPLGAAEESERFTVAVREEA